MLLAVLSPASAMVAVAVAQTHFYQKVLMDVNSSFDLVKRGRVASLNLWQCPNHYITGLHELRIAALIFGKLEGFAPEDQTRLLYHSHDGPVLSCAGISTLTADVADLTSLGSGRYTLLDLAVLLGLQDQALFLAENDIPLSFKILNMTYSLRESKIP